MEDHPLCPHCSSRPLPIAQLGENVIAVLHCPCKDELLIYFRGSVMGLKRGILERGTFDERKEHLGAIAAHIIQLGMQEAGINSAEELFDSVAPQAVDAEELQLPPISLDELEKFVRVDLRCLDNAAYFKRHFGN